MVPLWSLLKMNENPTTSFSSKYSSDSPSPQWRSTLRARISASKAPSVYIGTVDHGDSERLITVHHVNGPCPRTPSVCIDTTHHDGFGTYDYDFSGRTIMAALRFQWNFNGSISYTSHEIIMTQMGLIQKKKIKVRSGPFKVIVFFLLCRKYFHILHTHTHK